MVSAISLLHIKTFSTRTWSRNLSSSRKRNQAKLLSKKSLLMCFLNRFIHLFGRQSYRDKDHPSTFSHPKWSQQLELGQIKTRRLEFHPGHPQGCRGSSTCTIFHCFPGIIAGSWNGSGAAEVGTSAHVGCQHLRQQLAPFYHNFCPCSSIFLIDGYKYHIARMFDKIAHM